MSALIVNLYFYNISLNLFVWIKTIELCLHFEIYWLLTLTLTFIDNFVYICWLNLCLKIFYSTIVEFIVENTETYTCINIHLHCNDVCKHLPMSHLSPVTPQGHMHCMLPFLFIHVAPTAQGMQSQGSCSGKFKI